MIIEQSVSLLIVTNIIVNIKIYFIWISKKMQLIKFMLRYLIKFIIRNILEFFV